MASNDEESRRNRDMLFEWEAIADNYLTIHRDRMSEEDQKIADRFYFLIKEGKYPKQNARCLGGFIANARAFGDYKVTKE
jgi:hypothetical protein